MGNISHYDIILITNQPAFYKVKQWNQIATRKKVLMVFMDQKEKDRNNDFVSEKPSFEYYILPKSKLTGFWELISILSQYSFKQLIICGWDDWRLILLSFFSSKNKNAFISESSIYEYKPHFLKDIIKKLFLTRISTAYPSGIAQGKIFEYLGFKGEYKYTGGCGLLNYIEQPAYTPRQEVKTFLYVGRLVEVKNLRMLIEVFNQLPELNLNVIGFGEQEAELKQLAKENVHFLGAVANKQLSSYYQQADVFILPSNSEVWGLVIEEALNNGTPVIVSDKVGCRDDLVTEETGLVFNAGNHESLTHAIGKIRNIDFYNQLRKNIANLDFGARAKHQVDVFLD